eukprot:866608-Prorocentrum_minimum.AAC.1
MRTAHQVEALEWVDEEKPLWYQVKFHAAFGSADDSLALSDFSPNAVWTGVLPEAGLPENEHRVTLHVLVRDALGAVVSASVLVTVLPLAAAINEDEVTEVTGLLLGESQSQLKNGDAAAALVTVRATNRHSTRFVTRLLAKEFRRSFNQELLPVLNLTRSSTRGRAPLLCPKVE